MFIKITRTTARSENFELIIPLAAIKSVCSGYETGSRIRLAESRDEIEAHESVSEIWQMMKEMK